MKVSKKVKNTHLNTIKPSVTIDIDLNFDGQE